VSLKCLFVCWCLTALSAQIGYIVPLLKCDDKTKPSEEVK